jgi:pimeloyl-ACP methyl ester carboxylesterase
MPRDEVTALQALDGLLLQGTITVPDAPAKAAAVLVHGGGATREEGGFFTRLAASLAGSDIASLRFDLRGHGESEGRQEDLTLCAVANDIRAAVDHVQERTSFRSAALVGASFAGGITAFFASRYPEQVQSMVLLNPLLDYKRRFIDDKPYWTNDHIGEEAGRELVEQGSLAHSPTFKLGRALLNEVFHIRPLLALPEVGAPTLIVHGTGDTFVPVQSSRDVIGRLSVDAKLIEVDGAQHGFAVHDDPGYLEPQTQVWQASVIRSVTEWIIKHA